MERTSNILSIYTTFENRFGWRGVYVERTGVPYSLLPLQEYFPGPGISRWKNRHGVKCDINEMIQVQEKTANMDMRKKAVIVNAGLRC